MNNIRRFSDTSLLQGHRWMAQIDELVWMLVNESKKVPIKKEDLTYLYEAEQIVRLRYFSCPKASEERIGNIVREVAEAKCSGSFESFTRISMLAQTSKAHPLMMHEFNRLSEIVGMFNPKVPVLWGLGEDDSLGENVFLIVVLSKNEEQ